MLYKYVGEVFLTWHTKNYECVSYNEAFTDLTEESCLTGLMMMPDCMFCRRSESMNEITQSLMMNQRMILREAAPDLLGLVSCTTSSVVIPSSVSAASSVLEICEKLKSCSVIYWNKWSFNILHFFITYGNWLLFLSLPAYNYVYTSYWERSVKLNRL